MTVLGSNFNPFLMAGWLVLFAGMFVLWFLAIWKTLVILKDRVKLRRNTVVLCAPAVIVLWSVVFYFVTAALFDT
jgi:hypothetical protein